MTEHRQTEIITQQVLMYLKLHPDASDTVEGIAHWWLRLDLADAEALAAALDGLAVALDGLVESGLLERVSGSDGRLRYRKAKRGW